MDFAIRRLRSGDSLEAVTRLLHRSFGELAQRGIDCQCATQSVAQTRARIERGEGFIAVIGGEVIGTVTLEPADRRSAIPTYRDGATASVHQLAVDPARQGGGVGRSLIAHACAWARARRYDRLALDTPAGAARQVAWYMARGFDVAETVHVPGRRYGSLVLTRQLALASDRTSGAVPAARGRLQAAPT